MTTASGHTEAILASKVMGKSIKDINGEDIGEIEDIVLDKVSNSIMFVVVGFGGFLGVGEKYRPLPWGLLRYSEPEGAYVVNLSKQTLQAAPYDSLDALTADDGQGFCDRVYSYYKAPPH